MDTTINNARSLIAIHEGCTLVAIPDTNGWSIGYGHDGAIEGQTCTQAEAEALLDTDWLTAQGRAIKDIGADTWGNLAFARRAALTDMAYELGGAGLAEFNDMLVAIKAQDWPEAKHQALNSKWARQVPKRAAMDAEILLTGEWPVV